MPEPVHRVSVKPAAEVVVHPARGHVVERDEHHLGAGPPASARSQPSRARDPRQQRQRDGAGELRRVAEPAPFGIEARRQRAFRRAEDLLQRRMRPPRLAVRRRGPRVVAQAGDDRVRPARAPCRVRRARRGPPPGRPTRTRAARSGRPGGKYVPPTMGLRSGCSHTLIGQPPLPVVACTKVMYTRSTSGRSSRSTLTLTNSSFITAATPGSSNDSCAMTWHQWHVEYPTDRKIGLSSRARLGKRLLAPRVPIHRVARVLEQVGRFFAGRGGCGARPSRNVPQKTECRTRKCMQKAAPRHRKAAFCACLCLSGNLVPSRSRRLLEGHPSGCSNPPARDTGRRAACRCLLQAHRALGVVAPAVESAISLPRCCSSSPVT